MLSIRLMVFCLFLEGYLRVGLAQVVYLAAVCFRLMHEMYFMRQIDLNLRA